MRKKGKEKATMIKFIEVEGNKKSRNQIRYSQQKKTTHKTLCSRQNLFRLIDQFGMEAINHLKRLDLHSIFLINILFYLFFIFFVCYSIRWPFLLLGAASIINWNVIREKNPTKYNFYVVFICFCFVGFLLVYRSNSIWF